MRWIEEPFCRGDRPMIVQTVTISLTLIGCLLFTAAGAILLPAGGAVLIGMMPIFLMLGAVVVGAPGCCYLLLAWGYHEGYRWAWAGTVLGTMPLPGLAWVEWRDSHIAWAAGAWTLCGLALLIQMLAWLPSTRRLFWGRRQIDLL